MFVQDSMDLQQNIGFHGKNILKGDHKTFLQVNFLPFVPVKVSTKYWTLYAIIAHLVMGLYEALHHFWKKSSTTTNIAGFPKFGDSFKSQEVSQSIIHSNTLKFAALIMRSFQ